MHAAAGFKLLAKRENNFLAGCAAAAGIRGAGKHTAPPQQRSRDLSQTLPTAPCPTLPPQHEFRRLPPEDFCRLRRLVIHIILSTDMARHRDGLQEFGAALRRWGPDLGAWPPESRPLALQQLVHAADISNPARPLRFFREWGQRVHDEFFAQGAPPLLAGWLAGGEGTRGLLAVCLLCVRVEGGGRGEEEARDPQLPTNLWPAAAAVAAMRCCRRQGGRAGPARLVHLRPEQGLCGAEPVDVCGVYCEALLQVRGGCGWEEWVRGCACECVCGGWEGMVPPHIPR